MNYKKVQQLLGKIKSDIASLEVELQIPVIEKEYKNERFLIEYRGESNGGKNGFTKRDVFKFIVKCESKTRSLKELNSIFDKSHFPKTGNFHSYDYVIEKGKEKKLSKSTQENYLPLNVKSKDGKEIMVYGEWASFENRETKSPGNFPVLKDLALKLGYKITLIK